MQNYENIKKELPEIRRNVSLAKYTTFCIGGSAKYFFITKTKTELIEAIKVAKKYKLPFFILGEGSNILVSDKGYNGLIIKIKNQKSKIKNNIIYTETGLLLNQLVKEALRNNLSDLEWAIGIPGTVGGAIYGNAGSFGNSMKDIVKEVEVFDVRTKKIKIFKNKDCQFSYRDSIFKHQKNLIILSTKLRLRKDDKKKIKEKMKEFILGRKKTQPLNFPSAGSIFKNPSPSQVLKKFRRTRTFSAGELIEKCGLKGKKVGKAQISKKHANFIVNLEGAKAKDVKKLIKLIKKKVKNKFKINLEEEIQYLGF